MSNPSNPMDLDLTRLFALDPQRILAEWQRSIQSLNLPGVDLSAILEAQRKNIEAVTQANRTVLQGMQAVMQRQSELLQQSLEETAQLFHEADPGAPAQQLARQSELAREAFAKALSNMQELAEMAGRSQEEALQSIQRRFDESLKEIRAQIVSIRK